MDNNRFEEGKYVIELTKTEKLKIINALKLDMQNFKDGGANYSSVSEIDRYATGLHEFTNLIKKIEEARLK